MNSVPVACHTCHKRATHKVIETSGRIHMACTSCVSIFKKMGKYSYFSTYNENNSAKFIKENA